MSRPVEKIEKEIRALSAADRTALLRSLIAELDAPADPDVEKAWLDEAQRRNRELVDGKAEAVPGEEVFKKLRSRFGR